jgi:hypothetical protein
MIYLERVFPECQTLNVSGDGIIPTVQRIHMVGSTAVFQYRMMVFCRNLNMRAEHIRGSSGAPVEQFRRPGTAMAMCRFRGCDRDRDRDRD